MAAIDQTQSDSYHKRYENGTNADSRHIVAYRASSSFLGRGFYVAFFMGAEQRTKERLAREGQVQSFTAMLFSWITLAWMVFWVSALFIGVFVIIAYLLKSFAGIDMTDGPSSFHWFFFD